MQCGSNVEKADLKMRSCVFKNGRYLSEGDAVIDITEIDFVKRARRVYDELGIKYPKFHKMDEMCKSGFLAVEVLNKWDRTSEVQNADFDRTGVFISTDYGCIEVDEQYHNKTFSEAKLRFNPSLFVYTLPNILSGELSIRHGFKGEQATWMEEDFNTDFIHNYIRMLTKKDLLQACIIMRVNCYNNEDWGFVIYCDNKEDILNLKPSNFEYLKQELKQI